MNQVEKFQWLYPGARVWGKPVEHRRFLSKGTIVEKIDAQTFRVHWDGEEKPESVETPAEILGLLPESRTQAHHRYARRVGLIDQGRRLAVAGAVLLAVFSLGYRSGRMRR